MPWVPWKLIYEQTTEVGILFYFFYIKKYKKKIGVYQSIAGWFKAEWKMTSATNNQKLLAYYYKTYTDSVMEIITM